MLSSGSARLHAALNRWMANDLIRRVVKNSSYLFSATGVSAALSMLQGILAARMLGATNFGILGTMIVFTTTINKFASFRMSELVIKYVGQYQENGDQVRAAAVFKAAALFEILASFFAFGLVWVLAPLGAAWLAKDESLAGWFILYGMILIANLIAESSSGLLQIFDRYRRMAYLNVIQSIVTLAIIAAAFTVHVILPSYLNNRLGPAAQPLFPGILAGLNAVTYGGMIEVLAAYLIGKTVGALGFSTAAIIEARRHWGSGWWRPSLRLLNPQSRELAHFAVSTNISASLSLVNKDSELLWISLLRQPAEAGYFKVAMTFISLVQMPVTPIQQTVYPELSRQAARQNWKGMRQALRQTSVLAGGFTLAAALGLLIFGKPLLLLYGEEFLPAYPALLILLAGFLFANTFIWNRAALLALGRPDFPTKINLALAVLKVVGIILLVPRYGYLANAALLAGSYILGTSTAAFLTRAILSRLETAQAAEGAV